MRYDAGAFGVLWLQVWVKYLESSWPRPRDSAELGTLLGGAGMEISSNEPLNMTSFQI